MSTTFQKGDRVKVAAFEGVVRATDCGGVDVESEDGKFLAWVKDVEHIQVEKIKPDLLPVGTRVRVKYAAYFSEVHGLTGAIDRHAPWDGGAKGGGIHHYRVRLDESAGKWAGKTVYVRDLEEVKPEPKFKVGDRVRFVEDYGSDIRRGDVGTVVPPDPDPLHNLVKVVVPGKYLASYHARPERLELAPDQTFKLKPGDKIRNTKTGREGLAYRSIDLKALAVYDPKDWPDMEESRVPATAIEEYEEHHPGTYEVIEREGQPF